MSEAYDEGRAAFEAEEPRTARPYDGRTAEARDWLSGYDAAKAAKAASVAAESEVVLRPVGEATDPDVHYMLANKRAHEIVLATEDASPENKLNAEAGIRSIDARLKEMGYRA